MPTIITITGSAWQCNRIRKNIKGMTIRKKEEKLLVNPHHFFFLEKYERIKGNPIKQERSATGLEMATTYNEQ